ncbi:MAG TPA: NAD(P)-binding domain-containing protein [Candidatus Acidoferrales bacterium]|nr:NAD(P)-binding domain-containing protein [Candidatus Acidoferrales bacterium]
MSEIAIIGAGPYGLSIAAHLRAAGLDFRIFGRPMQTWIEHMPQGMRLKSEGFASSLYDSESSFTLAEFCRQKNLAYADLGLPVPLETFSEYGLEFQRRFVPQLENKVVVSVQRQAGEFTIRLADGETLSTKKIVMAVGLGHFAWVPPLLAALPEEFVTHSSRHRTLDRFRGREVVVVGAGASALDIAALLDRDGIPVQVVARRNSIHFPSPPPAKRSLLQKLRKPVSGLGPGWHLFLCTHFPLLFRRMPDKFRLEKVRNVLGPAPGWFVTEQVAGKMPFHLGATIDNAETRNGRVKLELTNRTGARQTIEADHVIAGTGYRVDLGRLSFLDPDLRAGIGELEHTPILSATFESSVPGLYFVGSAAANTFGPLMRFAYGARFAARRLTGHLAASVSRNPLPRTSAGPANAVDRDKNPSKRNEIGADA